MRVFSISDLHLSASGEKPMDIFGPEWKNHRGKLQRNWWRTVNEGDLVLLCGDLSWAMRLEGALPDLQFIDSLPGTKYFIRGNHDYWFSGPSKVRRAVGGSMRLIRFDAAVHEGVGICGVRAWPFPGHPEYDPEEDEKHWRRAILRLEMSLEALEKLDWELAVAMFHYPPRDARGDTELSELIREAGVKWCVYGHLHGEDAQNALAGKVDGVRYRCTSADRVGFTPSLLFEVPDR